MTASAAPTLPEWLTELDPIITPGELAAKWKVDPKTVTRWANSGRIKSFRTGGGHRRFNKEDVIQFYLKSQDSRGDDIGVYPPVSPVPLGGARPR